MSSIVFCLLLSCLTFHLGFVHPLQDVALHQCLPLSSVCCFPVPGGSLLPCYVVLSSSAWSSSWSLPFPWLPLWDTVAPYWDVSQPTTTTDLTKQARWTLSRVMWDFWLFVGCLTSQQQASISQGRICSDNFTCCHTEVEVANQTSYLTQSQYTDTRLTSPSTDPTTPGAWLSRHWSANV